MTIAEPVAYVAAKHTGKHNAEVHDAGSKGVMRHLVLAWSNLLHHEEGQTHEAEAITEVLQDNSTADEHEALRLIDGEESVCHEREVEHAAEIEERLLQSAMSDVLTGEDTTDDESSRSESSVTQTYLLLRESKTLIGTVCLEEERHNLHHESLGKAIENDEEYII